MAKVIWNKLPIWKYDLVHIIPYKNRQIGYTWLLARYLYRLTNEWMDEQEHLINTYITDWPNYQ